MGSRGTRLCEHPRGGFAPAALSVACAALWTSACASSKTAVPRGHGTRNARASAPAEATTTCRMVPITSRPRSTSSRWMMAWRRSNAMWSSAEASSAHVKPSDAGSGTERWTRRRRSSRDRGGGDESLGVDVELAEGAVGGEDARGAPTKRATPAENLGRFRGGSSVARVGVGVGGGGGGGARANGNRGRDAPGTGASVDGRARRATDARARTDRARVGRRGRREHGRHRRGAARSARRRQPHPPRREIRVPRITSPRAADGRQTSRNCVGTLRSRSGGRRCTLDARPRDTSDRAEATEMKTRRSFLLLLLLALALVGPHATGGGFTAEAASSKERRRAWRCRRRRKTPFRV